MSPAVSAATAENPSVVEKLWPPAARSAGRARQFTARQLDVWGMPQLKDSAELVVSELVTNAVTHAHPPYGQLISTRLERLGSGIRIEVHDSDSRRPEPREASAEEESGRGLGLVDALTGGRWGVSDRNGPGKVVWAVCADADAGDAPGRPRHKRHRPRRLRQEPEAVTWAREKSGLTKRALADLVGISEQLMGEMESGWRSATPANLAKIAHVLNCPPVVLERKRCGAARTPS